MAEDRIGLVLARTADLRLRIISSIKKESEPEEFEENKEDGNEEETDSLLNIKEALESLQGQLSSLQALQQQQWYEKESALGEIEYSRKKLLDELKEYKGNNLQVIHEAIAFASETEDDSYLQLPPYPTRPPHSDNGFLPSFPSANKFAQNGGTNTISVSQKSNGNHSQEESTFKWVKVFLGAAVKTSLTVVGVVAILSFSGFEVGLRRRDNQFKLSGLLKIGGNEGKECPPGKVPVVENDEARCIVKERVEIPFESDVDAPNVSYGYG